jgi:retron-type reverse transcriptase
MPVERRGPAVRQELQPYGRRGGDDKVTHRFARPRRRIYVKAKAEPTWRFWGLYVHVCKTETLQEAYQMAKSNHGAPGIDGITFDVIEERGGESFLKQIQDELEQNTDQPMPVRKKEFRRTGAPKSAFSRSPQSATAWFRVR